VQNRCDFAFLSLIATDHLSLVQMTSTRPYLRKKSVLIMYKVFLKFPDALRPAFPRLKEKLEDPDPGLCHSLSCDFYSSLSLLCCVL